MTLVQRVILSLPGYILLLFATWRSPGEGNLVSLIVTVIYAVISLPIIYLRYNRFRYWLTDTELVIKSGVLTRQHRNIPLDKIQNVEIVQTLLPRITGTAQVQVVTAGSSSAEGVLQFVSLEEAYRIREVVRSYSRKAAVKPETEQDSDTAFVSASRDGEGQPGHATQEVPDQIPPLRNPVESVHPDRVPLYDMSVKRVLLSGVFQFSLLYIAIIFSALQFFQPDPEKMISWLLRSRYDPFVEAVRASPISSALWAVFGAGFLSWISGIAVNFNKYFGFRLWMEGSKVGKRSGLLTLAEGSIPLSKIQALVLRTNPVREFAGFNAMHVQTMGLESNESGHRIVVPFARISETTRVATDLVSYSLPSAFKHVSKKRILRLFVRYSLLLLVLIVALYTQNTEFIWLVFASPLLFLLAYAQWRRHGYTFLGDSLGVRRGIIKRQTWILPVSKMQVFYTTQSFFQRRRGLKSVYVDSAGASSVSRPVIVDLEASIADDLVRDVYRKFSEITGNIDQQVAGVNVSATSVNQPDPTSPASPPTSSPAP